MAKFERPGSLGEAMKRSSFEDQFAFREKFKTVGGTAEVVDVRPEHPESLPLVIASAWAMGPDVYRGVLEELFKENRRAISIDHPRVGGEMTDEDLERGKGLPEAELRKALSLIDILNEKGIEKVDMIGHSEGGVNSAIAAWLHPEKVRTLILYAPGGLYGDDNFFDLVKRLGEQSPEQVKDVPVREGVAPIVPSDVIMKSMAEYVLKNPFRAYQEGKGVAESDTRKLIEELRAKGVHVVIVSAVNDPVFPPEKFQKMVNANMVDGFLSVRGGHGIPETYVKPIIQLTEAIERKEKKG